MINYYTILGVNENVSDEEISQAYRSLVRIHRKDVEQIKTINTAYNVLKKAEKRRDHDAELARSRSNNHSNSASLNRTVQTSVSINTNRSGSSHPSSHSVNSISPNNTPSQNNRSGQSSPPPLPKRNSSATSTSRLLPWKWIGSSLLILAGICFSIYFIIIKNNNSPSPLDSASHLSRETIHSVSEVPVKENPVTHDDCVSEKDWVKLAGVCYQVTLTKTGVHWAFQKYIPMENGLLYIEEQPIISFHSTEFMLFPIDILYFDNERRLVSHYRNLPPCHNDNCLSYSSGQPVRYVLELNAGQADLLNLKMGDELILAPNMLSR